uniref:Uncharacterized protein n=2 Tax=Oryza meridionalis TaxID=40149 RepID=A0A0E0C528_9ORYZ
MAILGLKEFGSGIGDLFCRLGWSKKARRGDKVWADDSSKQILRETLVICLAMDSISRMESAPAVSADMEWCDEFGLGSEEWTTKAEIKIRNVPEHECHLEKMERLVSSFCDAQTYSFDAMKKKYYICGFACSIESIPKYKYLKVKYGTKNGVRIKFFMLNLEAIPYVDPQKDGVANEKDPELYEDPDVVREAFESQARLQRVADGEESSSSADGSLSMSIDSDWSLKYGGR